MRISHHFRSPFVRIPFLVFAVIATVATSQPSWSLDEEPVSENINLEPGKSHERKVEYNGSQTVKISTTLKGGSPIGTKIRVEIEDANQPSADNDADAGVDAAVDAGAASADPNNNNDAGKETNGPCRADGTFEVLELNRWHRVGSGLEFWSPSILLNQNCIQKSGTSTIKITNIGTNATSMYWTVTAGISGTGSDEPEGAFVTAKVVP